MKLPAVILIGFVRVYQWVFSPLKACFGARECCRFSPSCSCYAVEALQLHGALRGSALSLRRILRCHPWGGAGFDPVPSAPRK